MKNLELKIPPVLIFLVSVVGIYNAPAQIEAYTFVQGFTAFIGFGIFVLGVLIGLIGVITFKRAKTTVNPVSVEKASSLVTHGIFRATRNPMYLGMALGIIGVSVYLQSNIIMSLFFLFFYISYMTRFQIVPEERVLTELFGDTYTTYLESTRRWL